MWARLTAVALAAAAVGAGLLAGSEHRASAGAGAPLNVLVVMTDDQRADDMDVMASTRRLVGRAGTTFTESFATFPLCCPSRATYVTGMYAHNHDIRDNGPPGGGAAVFRDTGLEADSVAVGLQNAGYRTAWFGKYVNGYARLALEDPPYIPPGYDDWRPGFGGRLYNWRQLVGGTLREWGNETSDYQTDVLARQASGFVERAAREAQPFFLTVAPFAPHGELRDFPAKRNPRPAVRHRKAFRDDPLRRLPSFNEADVSDKPAAIQERPRLDRVERQQVRARNNDRRASLLAVDDLVERVITRLSQVGTLDNTLVIFTSDNGYLMGEHRIPGGKDQPYEPAARVPLLVRGPGIPARREVSGLVGNIDLAATIYDAAGVEPLLAQDGVSLFDVAGDPTAYDQRDLLIETRGGVALRTPDFLYSERGAPATEFELYDLDRDPDQLESLHGRAAYQDERSELAARLDDLRDCAGDACR